MTNSQCRHTNDDVEEMKSENTALPYNFLYIREIYMYISQTVSNPPLLRPLAFMRLKFFVETFHDVYIHEPSSTPI